jgi:hypothetical protein
LVEAEGCGLVIDAGDGAGLAEAIRRLRAAPAMLGEMGVRARAAFERQWSEPLALARWREVIARAMA